MTQQRVNALLLISVVVMAVCPLLGALYFVDKALITSLNLGFNEQVTAILESSAEHLKSLGRLDPEHRDQYRAEFERVEALKSVYGSGDVIKQSLRDSLLIYFSVGVVAALIASIGIATLLSRKISGSFRATFEELSRNRERMRFLEEVSSWQELAKMLAHEIKNPLTPIEMLVTALRKAHRHQTSAEFGEHIAKTEAMVLEELSHLKQIVDKFSDFAKLPVVQLEKAEVRQLLGRQVVAVERMFESGSVNFLEPSDRMPLYANIDATLLRQALINLIRNGVEANPGKNIRFDIAVSSDGNLVGIVVANNGVPVPSELAHRMFDPYVTGKASRDNVGLGLAIVRKIALEHGGDITYVEREGHPAFVISLPRVA